MMIPIRESFNVIEHVREIYDRNHFVVIANQHQLHDYKFGVKERYTSMINPYILTHDMAHLIQMTETELHAHFYAHNGALVFKGPVLWSEPKTDAMCMRELETMWIQFLLEQNTNNKFLNYHKRFSYFVRNHNVLKEFRKFPDSKILFAQCSDDFARDNLLIEMGQSFSDIWNINTVKEKWYSIRLHSI